MPITLNGTAGVTFPDSVLQPNGVPAPGTSSNVLTSNGTAWTSTAPGAPTTAQVLTATAGATAGAVGTYAWLYTTDRVTLSPGDTKAGSTLYFANSGIDSTQNSDTYLTSPSTSGTWRCMGYLRPFGNTSATVFLRIS
jgi:hypothetical protein